MNKYLKVRQEGRESSAKQPRIEEEIYKIIALVVMLRVSKTDTATSQPELIRLLAYS